MEKKVKFKKDINVWYALLTLTIMISAMLYTVVKLQQPPHLPLLIGTSVAIIITMAHGYRWEEVEEMMYKGIRHALPAVVIIMLVGFDYRGMDWQWCRCGNDLLRFKIDFPYIFLSCGRGHLWYRIVSYW